MRPAYLVLAICAVTTMSQAAEYSIARASQDGVEIYVLKDPVRNLEVRVAPSLGNNSYQMTANGKRVFYSPYQTLAELVARPTQVGNPFLWPWANRIEGESYWFEGKKYLLNKELGNFRPDGNRNPIHGLLVFAKDWKVTRATADAKSATLTSRLEFWRNPQWLAQFPFPHVVEMTYRLSDGALEVETQIENLGNAAMPVSLGYHPYFQVNDAPRDEWKVTIAAKERMTLSPTLIPTGERTPTPYPTPVTLKGVALDDVFTTLVRGANGRAVFAVEGKNEKVAVEYGPNYPVAVIYAPPGRNFICFEPMTGPTNAFNAAHAGWYKELQTVPPGGRWKESFWIRTSGF